MPHRAAIISVQTAPLASPAGDGRSWLARLLRRWLDTRAAAEVDASREDRIDWLRAEPPIAMHLACSGEFQVGVSPIAMTLAAALDAVRMLAITGFYQRYFVHRSWQTPRAVHSAGNRETRGSEMKGPYPSARLHVHVGMTRLE
jgi:stearoyl-CoA desaturase (delta-9 desaturase)